MERFMKKMRKKAGVLQDRNAALQVGDFNSFFLFPTSQPTRVFLIHI